MNQILFNSNAKSANKSNSIKKHKKIFYKFQFTISTVLLLIIVIIYFFITKSKSSQDLLSQKITNSYNISRLYNNKFHENSNYNNNGQNFAIIGMIEIESINIYYPIISTATDDLLKISPCRIAGPLPNENGNLCIAGHNYDNYKFFSQISSLEKNASIKIYDLSGNFLLYHVYDIYEVSANDLTPLEQPPGSAKQLTLITCNNFNSNTRIIVTAFSV